MEVRALFIAIIATLLVGCDSTPEIKTSTQKVLVPVLYVPEPEKVERPALPIDSMTEEQLESDGEVVKHYKATVKALQGYSKQLELIIEDFRKKHKESEVIRKQVEEAIKKNNEGLVPLQ